MSLGTLKPSELWANLGNRRISSQVGPPCWLEQSVECVYLFQWISFIVFLAGITSSSGLTHPLTMLALVTFGLGPSTKPGVDLLWLLLARTTETWLSWEEGPVMKWLIHRYRIGSSVVGVNKAQIIFIQQYCGSTIHSSAVHMLTWWFPSTHHPRPIFDNLINPRFVPGD